MKKKTCIQFHHSIQPSASIKTRLISNIRHHHLFNILVAYCVHIILSQLVKRYNVIHPWYIINHYNSVFNSLFVL